MCQKILGFAAALFLAPSAVIASTILAVDAASKETLFYNSVGLPSLQIDGGNPGELLQVYLNSGVSFQGPYQSGAASILNFNTSSLTGATFDRVYLSLTSARTGAYNVGAVNVYTKSATSSDLIYPTAPLDFGLVKSAYTLTTSFVAPGTGGARLLVDVTAAFSIATDFLSLLIVDEIDDGTGFAGLGKNYISGFPDCATGQVEGCQYFAQSLYEYPMLIATLGSEVTPFSELEARPVTGDPTSYTPPPPPVYMAEPATFLLLVAGLVGLALQRRK